jgi:hypothetical protein
MTEVVRKTEGFGQILVKAKRARHRPSDLRHLEAVRKPHPKVIAIGRNEHLRFVPKTPEGNGVDDSVAIALKNVARPARARSRFGVKPSARPRWLRRNG